MKMKTSILERLLLSSALILGLFATEASAGFVKSQAPCSPVLGSASTVAQSDRYCFKFNAGESIPVVRSFSFNAPSAGTALVSFNGSMSCSSLNVIDDYAVTDFASQIVTDVNATPDVTGPSGLRHGVLLLRSPVGITDSFNLASERAVAIKRAGVRTFYFKLANLRMDPGTTCYVYNATFTVNFAP
jgi:hypothetical protein